MSKTKWYNNFKGYVEYAKVFEGNRDKGTGGKNPQVDKALAEVDGMYKFNFYPANEEILDKMTDILGEEVFGGGKRFKEGNKELGVGRYMTFKRPHKHKSGYDTLGGAPRVMKRGEDNKPTKWDLESDGLLGNGTQVSLTFTVYGEGLTATISPVELKIINHVEYNPAQNDPWEEL